MMARLISILIILGSAVLGTSSSAEKAMRGLVDVATIEDGEGHARILFHWDAEVAVEHVSIRRAVLKFDLAGEPESRSLEINVHPISVPWDASVVTWTRGWAEPGGDFDREVLSNSIVELSRGASEVAIDVTSVVKKRLEANEPLLGFLVTAHPDDGVGFRMEDLPRFSGLINGNLEMSWRKTPARPPELDHLYVPREE